MHAFQTLAALPLGLSDRVWLLRELHRMAGCNPPPEAMTHALLKRPMIRSLRQLSTVKGFGRRRRQHLRRALRCGVLDRHLPVLLHTLTNNPPVTPHVAVMHPLGAGVEIPTVVADQLLVTPPPGVLLSWPDGIPTHHPQLWSFPSVLNEAELPKHLVIVGGNYAGVELAFHWLQQGHLITIVHNRRHLLAGHIPHTAQRIHQQALQAGMTVLCECDVVGWRQQGMSVGVVVDAWDGMMVVLGDGVVLTP